MYAEGYVMLSITPSTPTVALPRALLVPARLRPVSSPSLTALAALAAAVRPYGARVHAVEGELVTLAADFVGPYWRGTARDILLAAHRARRATSPMLTFDVALGRTR